MQDHDEDDNDVVEVDEDDDGDDDDDDLRMPVCVYLTGLRLICLLGIYLMQIKNV